MNRAPAPSSLLRDIVVSGTIASIASTAALALMGRRELRDAAAPVNGPSQWVWGQHAPYRNGFSVRYTVVGHGIHHLASTFWAALYEVLRPGRRHGRDIAGDLAAALATSAAASFVDYRLTPPRLRPGFEKRLSRKALLVVYGAFALGLAAHSLVSRR
jgi:hypothetical protein